MDLQHLFHAAENATSVHYYYINYFRLTQRMTQATDCQLFCKDPHVILNSPILVSKEVKLLNFHFSKYLVVLGNLNEHILLSQHSLTEQHFTCLINGQCVMKCWPRLWRSLTPSPPSTFKSLPSPCLVRP